MGRSTHLRSYLLLGGTLALVGCAGQAPQPPFGGSLPSMLSGSSTPSGVGESGKSGGPVALLLPLTGTMAPVGQVLENAAKLALGDGSGLALDIRDTGSTPQGATSAAQAALAAGDGLILGPLTSAEAHAVAPLAQAAGVNVLAFTNDDSVAAPGFWPMGITPTQQVQRVVQNAADAGRTQIVALLPDTDFGHSLANALNTETAALSEPSPAITFYQDDFNDVNQAVRDLSDFADRGQSIEDQIKAAQDLGTPAGREKARELQRQQIPPPAFNTLFIGATSGDTLAEIANFLPFYAVSAPQVQILGPALWAGTATQLAANPAFNGVYDGALYAAPDPASATAFDLKYQSVYGNPPPAIADVAFDATAIARLAATTGGYTRGVLTDAAGFTGTDGVLRLLPSGQVERGLAVFQVAPGGPAIASPAPTQLTAPSS